MDYHLDPRMPRPDQCVQRYMIERWAREQPDKIFAIFADGEQWTYGRDAGAGDSHGERAARARSQTRRARPGVAAEQCRLPACLVRPQLSRRRVRADQHRLSRQPARACHRLVGSAPDDRACRSLSAAERCRSQGRARTGRARRRPHTARRHQRTSGRRAGERRHQPAAARAADRALGHAIDHLHVRHDGALQGRDVVLRAPSRHGGLGTVPVRRRPLHDQSADVPLRRRDAGHRHADPWRVDRHGGFLQHRSVLADRPQGRHHHLDPARRDGRLSAQAAALLRRQGPSAQDLHLRAAE